MPKERHSLCLDDEIYVKSAQRNLERSAATTVGMPITHEGIAWVALNNSGRFSRQKLVRRGSYLQDLLVFGYSLLSPWT